MPVSPYWLVAFCVVLSMPLQAQQLSNEISIAHYDTLRFSAYTQINNFYLLSVNERPAEHRLPPAFMRETNHAQQLSFNGGYLHDLRQELQFFVEAGVNKAYQDIASQRGYNLATGLKYQPQKGLSFTSKLRHTAADTQQSSLQSLEISSSVEMHKKVNLEARYILQSQSLENSEQSLRFGVGYRF